MLVGKQSAGCTYNCIYCNGKAPYDDHDQESNTLGFLVENNRVNN